jgi:Fungal specific transcription factor domain
MFVLGMLLPQYSRLGRGGDRVGRPRRWKMVSSLGMRLMVVSDTAVIAGPSRTESTMQWTGAPMESLEDLRLMHYYTFDLAHTLSLPGAIGRTWSDGVPRLAFQGDHVYLIHALLAVSAAHRVSKDRSDVQSQQRGQMHYVMCLSLLKSLDLNTNESHASAALAAVMLLSWYEVLPFLLS